MIVVIENNNNNMNFFYIGGLQVKTGDQWIDVPPNKDVFVCNIGDMLGKPKHNFFFQTINFFKIRSFN